MMKNTLLALMLVIPAVSFAQNKFTIGNSTITVPDTGKFYISMQNEVPVNGMNFIIQFDASLIVPINMRAIERGNYNTGSGAYQFASDKISFVIYRPFGFQISPGAGRIFEIEYTVNRKALTKKVITTQVAFYEGIVADSTLKVMSFDYVNGTITINDPTVGVEEQPSQLPVRFELSQNYPNPFNPTTVITYALPAASNISLRIYDIVGREVRTLVDEVQPAGYKTVEWDSKNKVGIRVASGVYFYRLEATKAGSQDKSFVQIKRMLLLK
jgi:hypothetical protein